MKRKVTMGAAAAGLALGLAIPLIGQRGGDSASPAADPAPAAAAATARAGTSSTQQDFRWAGRIARGDEIEVRGIVGDIRAEYTSGDEVVVTAANPGRIPIRVVETEDGVTVCAAYHEDERYQRHRGRDDDVDDEGRRESTSRMHHHDDDPCDMDDGRGIHIDIDDDDVDAHVDLEPVDFTVRVPAGVRFSGVTIEGDVEAGGLRSSVHATSVSGNVRVATSEEAEATTVSGDVDVTLGRMPADGELSFTTVSGDVDLRIPAGADADVKAHTLSGEIEADFPLERGPMVDAGGEDAPFNINVQIGRRAEGRIGRGGASVELTTISGDIRVKRGS